ncbi:hypothetical protein CPB83DRAFT_687988 [Crepidotus variabilis]|uniref:Uncharacterized protein n=1 Tax=Crepidotus variabilis TaxID=179855 RepID=A0A9P6JK29_9AGAR|nr:hypothetical protein CPB83DRAFT_687988 [Crepidotus variabilis]
MWDITMLDRTISSWHKNLFTMTLEHVPCHYLSSCELSMDPQKFYHRMYHARTLVLRFWPFHPHGAINHFDPPTLRYRAVHHVSSPDKPAGMDTALELLSQPEVHNFVEELDFSPSTYLPTPQLLAKTIGRLPQLRIVILRIEVSSLISFFSSLTFGTSPDLDTLPFRRLKDVNVLVRISSDAEAEKEILRSMVERRRLGSPVRRLRLPPLHSAGYVRDLVALQQVLESVTIKSAR